MTRRLWAIADLHLGLSTGKWMDRFGDHWKDHHRKVEASWRERIAPEDIVLLPGDFSWAMKLEEVAIDFRWLGQLPGKKVLIKGNHDYWWPKTKKKMQSVLPPETYALKKNAIILDGLPIVGVRGGDFFPSADEDPADVEAELKRELRELRLSIEHLRTLGETDRSPVAMFHYPPFPAGLRDSVFTVVVEEAGVATVVYGHLHSKEDWARYFQGEHRGIEYHLVSCDALDFVPKLLGEV